MVILQQDLIDVYICRCITYY